MHLSDNQREITDRLAAGERLAGPVMRPVSGHGHRRRRWSWQNGSGADDRAVQSLARRGVLCIHHHEGIDVATLAEPQP